LRKLSPKKEIKEKEKGTFEGRHKKTKQNKTRKQTQKAICTQKSSYTQAVAHNKPRKDEHHKNRI
jgi:hypothetical protein